MKTLVIGNSGSGKTTLGRSLAQNRNAEFLSLDALAFERGATRRAIADSISEGIVFLGAHSQSVLEGCYADIAQGLSEHLDQLVFLNPGSAVCVAHCRARPWEADKYESKAAQDAMLSNLIEWVQTYDTRDDEYGLRAHRTVFEQFAGEKIELCDPSTYWPTLQSAWQ